MKLEDIQQIQNELRASLPETMGRGAVIGLVIETLELTEEALDEVAEKLADFSKKLEILDQNAGSISDLKQSLDEVRQGACLIHPALEAATLTVMDAVSDHICLANDALLGALDLNNNPHTDGLIRDALGCLGEAGTLLNPPDEVPEVLQ